MRGARPRSGRPGVPDQGTNALTNPFIPIDSISIIEVITTINHRCAKCGHSEELSNVLKCPFCFRLFEGATDEMVQKHVRKCAESLNPRKFSERKRGRPAFKEYRHGDPRTV